MTNRIAAVAGTNGLSIKGFLFDGKVPLESYEDVFGLPSRTIDAGPPAPAGHRNNHIHIFDSEGVYLTEHHASRLIESVNFIFRPADSPFPIEEPFCGELTVDGQEFRAGMVEADLDKNLFARDLPGEYSSKCKNCWVGVSFKAVRDARGKRRNGWSIVRVSVCF